MQGLEFNTRLIMGGARLLARLPDRSVDLAFFDPQHRNILNRQKYGNEGARQKGRAKLQVMDGPTIWFFIEEIERVVKPSGHLMLWVDKYIAAQALWRSWFNPFSEMKAVDFIAWRKTRFGMGARARAITEYLIVLQRQPIKAAGKWTDRSIEDCWIEAAATDEHPHAKPIGLIQRLIKATTKSGGLVLDPAAGSFVVLDACRATKRRFIGCDIAADL